MGLGLRRGVMWAGIVDDHIATDTDKSTDEYTPITVALFRTRQDAERHYQSVVKIDVDKLLMVSGKHE